MGPVESGIPDIRIEDILAIKYPAPGRWSADGKQLAFIWDDGGARDLWVVCPGGNPVRVSDGQASVRSYDWSPDGHLVYAQSNQIWTVQPGRQPRLRVAGPGVRRIPCWSPDGSKIAFADEASLSLFDLAGPRLSTLRLPGPVAAGYVQEGRIRWSPDGTRLAVGVLEGGFRQIVVVDLEGTVVWRTASDESKPAFAWVDNRRLHYTAMAQTCMKRTHRLVDVDRGAEETLVSEESHTELKRELAPVVRPGGAGIVYVLPSEGWLHLFYLDLPSRRLEPLTGGECEDTGSQEDWNSFSPCGRWVVFPSNRGTGPNERRLWKVDVETKELRPVTPGPGNDTNAAWSPGGERIAFLRCGPFETPDLWTVSPDGSGMTRLTSSMPEDLETRQISVPAHVTFAGRDGATVHGDLLLPKGFDPRARYAAVVFLHGGVNRQMRYGWHPLQTYSIFYSFNQYLLHRGFVVLSVDYRGSIGYGCSYEQGNYMGVGETDLMDVVAGADYLRSLEYVDGSRLGVYGISYGGYLTLGAMTRHAGTFAVGVNIAGIWNWDQYQAWLAHTFPGEGWRRMARMNGPRGPHNQEVWDRATPHIYAPKMQGHLLSLMGTSDERVDFAQMDSIVRDCTKHGKSFDLMYYPGETHTFTWRATWADAFRRIEQTFRRHLAAARDGP